ncbi:hypothetical protein Mucpa_2118 [Mucilaginibacter paludis DSM 18603]|uniref:Uncharacterized protein n=1 Tax=Mucilaginibacter paludis DSM 18603 TaxID=714943 RepID=H1YFB9_9SPHI|nr:hypothetical protein Mucpa_2118 [Mucilaginibacter paludis DSM 18603]
MEPKGPKKARLKKAGVNCLVHLYFRLPAQAPLYLNPIAANTGQWLRPAQYKRKAGLPLIAAMALLFKKTQAL